VQLWHDFKDVLQPNIDIEEYLNEFDVILGMKENDLINLLFLKVKYYLYACKYRDTIPNITGLMRVVKLEYNVEKQIAQGNTNQMLKLHTKWSSVENLIQMW